MTQIYNITIAVPNSAAYQGYNVELIGLVTSETLFDQIRELFSLCESTAIQMVPGRRPIPYDPTEDEINIWYITWTHGDKPENGWYLLRSFRTADDESAQGHSQYFVVGLVFLGTTQYKQDGFRVKGLEIRDNDWSM